MLPLATPKPASRFDLLSIPGSVERAACKRVCYCEWSCLIIIAALIHDVLRALYNESQTCHSKLLVACPVRCWPKVSIRYSNAMNAST